jgi:hypothetical protein
MAKKPEIKGTRGSSLSSSGFNHKFAKNGNSEAYSQKAKRRLAAALHKRQSGIEPAYRQAGRPEERFETRKARPA